MPQNNFRHLLPMHGLKKPYILSLYTSIRVIISSGDHQGGDNRRGFGMTAMQGDRILGKEASGGTEKVRVALRGDGGNGSVEGSWEGRGKGNNSLDMTGKKNGRWRNRQRMEAARRAGGSR